jgi:hypothetical protein
VPVGEGGRSHVAGAQPVEPVVERVIVGGRDEGLAGEDDVRVGGKNESGQHEEAHPGRTFENCRLRIERPLLHFFVFILSIISLQSSITKTVL